jgi:hypothetical protein
MEGYQYLFDEKLVTVWSAPNYCYRNQNAASILTLNEDGSREITMFEAAQENYSDPAILAKMTVRKYPRSQCKFANCSTVCRTSQSFIISDSFI